MKTMKPVRTLEEISVLVNQLGELDERYAELRRRL
jgi:hypothetical protein